MNAPLNQCQFLAMKLLNAWWGFQQITVYDDEAKQEATAKLYRPGGLITTLSKDEACQIIGGGRAL